jgi:hypothetical protein
MKSCRDFIDRPTLRGFQDHPAVNGHEVPDERDLWNLRRWERQTGKAPLFHRDQKALQLA